jgi:hypothetical protein
MTAGRCSEGSDVANLNGLFDFDSCYDPDCGVYWLGCRCRDRRYARLARTQEQSLQRWLCRQRDTRHA